MGVTSVFPALWGKDSYNWGAGMHRINTAAGFIQHNMPLGRGETLSDQEAWDVAAYINSHERPQDPRLINGSIDETRKRCREQGYPKFTDEQTKAYTELGGTPFLDGQYTVFGEVVEGLDVVEKIQNCETLRDDRPKEDVVMQVEVVNE